MDKDVKKFRKFLLGLEQKDQNIIDLSIPDVILYAEYHGPAKSKCQHWVYQIYRQKLNVYLLNGQLSQGYIWEFCLKSSVCLVNNTLIPFKVKFYIPRYIGGLNCVDKIKSNFKLIRNLTDLNIRTDEALLNQIQIPGESNPKKAFGMDPRIFRTCWAESHYQLARMVQNILHESYPFYTSVRWNRFYWNIESMDSGELSSKTIRYLLGLSTLDQDYYTDYRRMRRLFNPVPKEYSLYPIRVKELHDKLCHQVQEIRDKERELARTSLDSKYLENYYPKAKKYEYEFDKYQIIACKSLSELTEEGKVLRHCVGSYIDSVGNGKEYILFLRNKLDLDKPLYTINISADNELRQIHGMCNRNLPNSLVKMLTPWAEKFHLDLSHASGVCCHL